jgi:hypothetical protein
MKLILVVLLLSRGPVTHPFYLSEAFVNPLEKEFHCLTDYIVIEIVQLQVDNNCRTTTRWIIPTFEQEILPKVKAPKEM